MLSRLFRTLLINLSKGFYSLSSRLPDADRITVYTEDYLYKKFGLGYTQLSFPWPIYKLPECFNNKTLVAKLYENTNNRVETHGKQHTTKERYLYDFGDVVISVDYSSVGSNLPDKMLNGETLVIGDEIKNGFFYCDNYKISVYAKQGFDFRNWDLYGELLSYRGAPEPDSPKRGFIHVIISTQQGFDTKRMPMREVETDVDLYYDDYIGRNFDTLCNNVEHATNGIFIFHGTPGTGKTYLIREIARRLKGKREFIFLPASMSALLGQPNFIQFMLQYSGYALVIEDGENVLMSRESTMGSNPATSNILQLGDGFLGDVCNMPILVTFNTDLSKIDSAILRKGRCLFKHEFNELPQEQVNRLCEHLGVPLLNREATLSEVFNQDAEDFDGEKDLKPIGFTQPKSEDTLSVDNEQPLQLINLT